MVMKLILALLLTACAAEVCSPACGACQYCGSDGLCHDLDKCPYPAPEGKK